MLGVPKYAAPNEIQAELISTANRRTPQTCQSAFKFDQSRIEIVRRLAASRHNQPQPGPRGMQKGEQKRLLSSAVHAMNFI